MSAAPAPVEQPADMRETFDLGQWLYQELDAVLKDGTADQRRALAVVRKMVAALAAPAPAGEPVELTRAQYASACLSYRHDFGLLSEEQQHRLLYEAREWDRALQKERTAPPAAARVPLTDEQRTALVLNMMLHGKMSKHTARQILALVLDGVLQVEAAEQEPRNV